MRILGYFLLVWRGGGGVVIIGSEFLHNQLWGDEKNHPELLRICTTISFEHTHLPLLWPLFVLFCCCLKLQSSPSLIHFPSAAVAVAAPVANYIQGFIVVWRIELIKKRLAADE